MILSAKELACGYGSAVTVEGVSFTLSAGDILCLLGPNGAGKTTLFRTLLGLNPPIKGTVRLGDRLLHDWPANERARRLGYVPQSNAFPFPFRVADIVVMGRAPYLDLFAAPGRSDWREVDAALDAVGVLHLRERTYDKLSGGEQRLVLIARVLAQRASILVLDEPMANLDLGNQIRFMRAIRKLADAGYGVLLTTHAPDHALQCATSVLAIYDRRVQAQGPPDFVITEKLMRGMYGESILIVRSSGVVSTCMPGPNCFKDANNGAKN